MRPSTVLATLLALLPGPLLGQTRADSFFLAGTWTLVAADEIRPDGRRVASYGADPHGVLMIDGEGRYSLQIFRLDRPKFASGDKRRGTAAEYSQAVLGASTHVGRVAVDPAHDVLIFRIERASFPNWEGTEQRRPYTLMGDELSYRVPASADGVVPVSVWRRVYQR